MSFPLAEDMKQAIAKYCEAIKADYMQFMNYALIKENAVLTNKVAAQQIEDFNRTLVVEPGKKYLKVLTGGSVHSFIVAEDGEKFKRGDILKAASWKQPAKNQARGNIFGEYRVLWTGTQYLR